VIGCSTAYHLAKLGWKGVILLGQNQITAGTTWHAAGLVEALGFFSETKIGMAKYTLELYAQLEKETGQATGFEPGLSVPEAHKFGSVMSIVSV
jgi:4-methylaminobutanoate oxidase (formaldehyde-forming)